MLRALGLSLVLLTMTATAADADAVVVYGDLQGGGMYGKATGGDAAVQDQAFFANVPNALWGLSVSGRFLFLGGTIQHQQFVGNGDLATWTQLTAGLDFAVDLGGDTPSAAPSDKDKKKERKGAYVHLTAGGGFGVGTGQQVDPPLDNAQIDDKAFLLQGSLGIGKHLGSFLDVGLSVPVTYGYFFKNGVPANDLSNHYQGIHVEALAYLRLYIKLL
ncbi:MAG TPA: hypothetical protein VFQ53_23815 [Kofleriaceae bacterium]|nr:hypothetical protein [Kofleriaceae bacterium]